jgi:hypothetical protein
MDVKAATDEVTSELVAVEEAGVELVTVDEVVPPHAARMSAKVPKGNQVVIFFIIFLLS